MKTYYYETKKATKGPTKIEAETDGEAVAKATERASMCMDELLMVYEEENDRIREVFYAK